MTHEDMKNLIGKIFERATLFEPGFLMGFRQSEIKNLRFGMATDNWGKEHFAAQFIVRGKRKKQIIPAKGLVIIEGWAHPELEVAVEDTRSGGITVKAAKFTAFSSEWNVLLNNYLEQHKPEVIFDGRTEIEPSDVSDTFEAAEQPIRVIEATLREVGYPDEIVASGSLREGATTQVLVNKYERNRTARQICLDHHGYTCKACEVNMEAIYGELGRNFVHVHHVVPLADIGEDYEVNPINDLVPVCPNCHAMLHRSERVLSVEDLRAIIAANRDRAA